MIAAAGMLVLMNFTAPMEIGPLGVLLFFTTVYVVTFGVSTLVIWVFTKIMGKGMTRKEYTYAGILGFTPIMLLMLQSFGAFKLWSVGLVALFDLIACFIAKKIL